MSSQEESLPARPREEQTGGETSSTQEKNVEGAEPSKNALKKAAKEKEKAEKAAKREQKEKEEREAREKADAANDTAKHLYGDPPSEPASLSSLSQVSKWTENDEVTIRTRVQTSRSQAASTCFLVLGEGFHTLQAVVAEGGGQGVSRQMVKWCKKLNSESLVQVTGLVKKAELKSVTIKEFELHVKSIYMISEAEEKLPIQTKDCRGPPPAGEENEVDAQGNPNVGLKNRLDHRVLSLRTPASQAIFKLQGGVRSLFVEYMSKHGGTWFEPSYLAGASTEGGADVFEVKYFEKKAYLTQSPQFYKQMAIAGDMGLVYTTGPVFRAENSNTKRHLTEVPPPSPPNIPSPPKTNPPLVHRPRLRNAHNKPLPRSPHLRRKPRPLHNPAAPNPRTLQDPHRHPPRRRLPRSRQLQDPGGRRTGRADHIPRSEKDAQGVRV